MLAVQCPDDMRLIKQLIIHSAAGVLDAVMLM
jgi:hypothetical protein